MKKLLLGCLLAVGLGIVSSPVDAQALTGTALLTWTPPVNAPVDGNRIERGPAVAGPFTVLATIGAVSTYSDAGLTPGATFCYRVAAFNTVGQGPYSNVACGTVISLPGAPTSLTITITIQ